MLISKLYRQMYANTGIATDSARVNRSARWARMIAKPCRRLFAAQPMPDLQVPQARYAGGHSGSQSLDASGMTRTPRSQHAGRPES